MGVKNILNISCDVLLWKRIFYFANFVSDRNNIIIELLDVDYCMNAQSCCCFIFGLLPIHQGSKLLSVAPSHRTRMTKLVWSAQTLKERYKVRVKDLVNTVSCYRFDIVYEYIRQQIFDTNVPRIIAYKQGTSLYLICFCADQQKFCAASR